MGLNTLICNIRHLLTLITASFYGVGVSKSCLICKQILWNKNVFRFMVPKSAVYVVTAVVWWIFYDSLLFFDIYSQSWKKRKKTCITGVLLLNNYILERGGCVLLAGIMHNIKNDIDHFIFYLRFTCTCKHNFLYHDHLHCCMLWLINFKFCLVVFNIFFKNVIIIANI